MKLNSPVWPEEILGEINREKAARGKTLFDEYCEACHARIDREDPNRRIIANMTKVNFIGTDSAMAKNSFTAQGYSGILRNQYVGLGVGNILLDKQAPVAALLTQATRNVVATPDPDKWFFNVGRIGLLILQKHFMKMRLNLPLSMAIMIRILRLIHWPH